MLKINVGLSRKVTEDYNSRGFSLNLEGELPSDILADEKALAQSTERLFQLANQLLDNQVGKATKQNHSNGNGYAPNRIRTTGSNLDRTALPGHNRNNSPRKDDGPSREGDRLLTQAQDRAIRNMTRKLDLDTDDWAYNEFGLKTDQLTVKQASEAIELLKQHFNRNGVAR